MVLAPRAAASQLPAVTVVMAGSVYEAGAPAQIRITLRIDPGSPAGSVEFANSGVFTMREVALQVLEEVLGGSAERALYRLSYAIDQCEHAQPVATGESNRWDVCAYHASQPRPKHLVRAEALVKRERRPEGEYVVAAGVPDAHTLGSVYRATGKVGR